MKKSIITPFRLFVATLFLGGGSVSALTNVVINTSNTGVGSLHWAITNANAIAGADTIKFAIPGVGPHMIQPVGTGLPAINGNLTIDGYTQSGASSNTLAVGNNAVLQIELNGGLTSASTDGLIIAGNNVTLRGLAINAFTRHGIWKNGASGIGSNYVIEGCFIGTDVSGLVQRTNLGNGIDLDEIVDCRIGGTNAGSRNVISGNKGYGLRLDDDRNSVVQGNYIGTDRYGTNQFGGLGNGLHGIITEFGSTNCLIGGDTPAARNVISGNGTLSTPPDLYEGIQFSSINSRIQGNYIGPNASGTALIGNYGQGISVFFGDNNFIGGTNAGEANLIAGNGEDGVFVIGDTIGFYNAILGNSIYGNGTNTSLTGQIGIDLFNDVPGGVTTNDLCDADVAGGNHFQNFPVLTNSVCDGTNTTISGYLNSTPNDTFILEFFENPYGTSCEGRTFLGRTNFNSSGSCSNNFSVNFPLVVQGGANVSATVSRLLGGGSVYDTSEFSACIANNGPIILTTPSTIPQNGDFCINWYARGGTTNYVQRATNAASSFSTISPAIINPPGPWVATNYCDPGAAMNNPASVYRILYTY